MPNDAGRGGSKSRILVVDDEPDIQASLRDLFEASLEDVEVVTCPSGQEGLRILTEQRIDVIVSDYKMPGMNGLEFLQKARAQAPDVPRILATAFPDTEIAVRAINEIGIENFLTKPFEPDRAIEVISRILTERRRAAADGAALAGSLRAQREGSARGA